MPTIPSLPTPLSPHGTTGATPGQHATAKGRRVTDAPTRMFHWLFALSFVGAYVSADAERFRLLHVTLGYTMAGLLVARIVYGWVGPRSMALGSTWRKVAGLGDWIRSLFDTTPGAKVQWRQGQNLLMSIAIVGMLTLVIPLTLSGYGTYNDWGDFLGGDWLEEVHELVANTFLLIVLGHLAMLLLLSVLRQSNQARPMLSGRLPGSGPDLVKSNRGWLAAVLLLCVLAFGAWQWQQSPQGLWPTSTTHAQGGQAQVGKAQSGQTDDGDDD